MKLTIIYIFFTILSNLVFSQNKIHDEAFKNFKENYNAGNYEYIFDSFSNDMQKALPIEKTKQFFNNLKTQAGKIKNGVFLKFEKNFAIYKTDFEKTVFTVNISLNEDELIQGLFVKPYVEEIKSSMVNYLSDFPNGISKSIYSNTNIFPDKTQLSIAVIKNGIVKYYGIIIKNDTLKSIQNQTKVFEIGSITKVFTSSVLASLVIENKIKLDGYVNDYYPFSFKNNSKINFLNLANHTSGLPRLPDNIDLSSVENPYKIYGKEKLNEYFEKNLKFNNNPETKYEYSNLGVGLLGYSLGLSQKQEFNDLLKTRIFKKYKMQNSFTGIKGIENKIVKGLNDKGQEVSNWEFDALFSAGGILSTTEDLVKFAQAQFDKSNKELELTRKPTFDVNDNMKIGLGWHILKSKNGFNWVWHNGGTGGYSSSFVLDVEEKNGVVILSNVSTFNPKNENIDNLCFELMKQIENE